MSRVQLPNNEEAIIADFALDSTAQAMLTQLVALNKGIGSGNLQKLVEHAKKAAKDSEAYYKEAKKQQEDLHKATEDLGEEFKKTAKQAPTTGNAPGSDVAGPSAGQISKAADQAAASLDGFNKGAARGEAIFVSAYGAISSAIKGISASIVLYGGILVDSFVGLGSELNELTKVGGGFTDSLSRGGMSAVDAMGELSSMGIDAANTMKNMSGIMQTMNKKAFVGLTKSFMDATDSGVELGMSLDDSVERMGAELAKRQQMGVLDGMNQARMQKQITRSIKTQQKYASVLGESVDEIVAFTDSLITQTPVLTSSLLRFDKELRGKVIAGITDFGSTMRAMGGEEGGQIAAAMTEAAASGAMGFSESMTGYVRALPSLAGPMNDYIKQIKNGTLSQEDAEQMALDMTSQLGNLSAAEKNRVFLLDRAGDAQASSMAKAIIQFEASAKKLKGLNAGLSMDGVQTGTNTLSRIMKEISGAFESIKLGFLGGLGDAIGDLGKLGGESGKLTLAFKNAQNIISEALFPAIAEIFPSFADASDGVKGLADGAKGLGANFGKRLIPMIGTAAEYIANLIKRIPDMIEGIKSFAAGVKTAFNVIGGVFDVLAPAVSFVAGIFTSLGNLISGFFNIFSSAPDPKINEVDADGKPTQDALDAQAAAAAESSRGLGKLIGGVALAVLAFKSVSGVMGLFGKKLPSLFGSMKKTEAASESNFKSLDTAQKKSNGFIKRLSTGMKDLSKGISDMLTNLSKGISNTVSNLATGIQKGISALSKGIADAGKGIGAGIGGLLKGTLTGLGQGLKVLGDPKVLLGVVALTGIGAAMFVAGKAFQQFSDINWAGVAAGAVALGVLGAAAFLLAPIAPVIGVGALAIGALGLALIPFAAAVKIAAPAMVELMGSFQLLNDVDPKNVLLLGPGLVSLAAGMAAFSAGGLISGVLDGLGSLFGSESPFDKLAKIGAAAPAINEMTSNMNSFGTTVETFNDAMTQLDGAAISGEFDKMAEGIDTLNASMAEISLVSLMKMAAMKSFGPIVEEPATEPKEAEKPKLTDQDHLMARAGDPDAKAIVNGVDFSTPSVDEAQVALDTALAAQAKGIHDFADAYDQMALDAEVKFAQMDLDNAKRAEVDKGAATKTPKTRAEMTPYERAQARSKSREATMARGGIASSVSQADADRSRAQAPAVAKAMQPTTATSIDPPTVPANTTAAGTAGENGGALPQGSNTELFERMVANQEQTNSLLRRGNKTTADLKDNF